jgi:PleD family two-component response regulator
MLSYDLIVRMGGDEFICVMSDATVEIARRRFGAVQADLAADTTDRCEIRFGVAELAPEDSALDLVKRADAKQPPS